MIALARRLTLGLIPALLLITLSLSVSASASTRVDVRISGVEGELLNNVKAYLQIANLDSNRDYVNYQIRYLHRQAAKEIKQALQPFGYYSVGVNSELQSIEAGAWRADYQITLNNPVRVTQNQ